METPYIKDRKIAKVKQLLASLLVLPRGQGPETIPVSWNTRYSTNGFKHLISRRRLASVTRISWKTAFLDRVDRKSKL